MSNIHEQTHTIVVQASPASHDRIAIRTNSTYPNPKLTARALQLAAEAVLIEDGPAITRDGYLVERHTEPPAQSILVTPDTATSQPEPKPATVREAVDVLFAHRHTLPAAWSTRSAPPSPPARTSSRPP